MLMNIKNYDNKISKIESDVSSANTRITTNASNISGLTTRVTKSETDISGLNTRVTTNASNISSANTLISKNTADITATNTRVTTNASNIATANTKITKLETDLSGTNSRLTTLTTNVNAVSDLAYNHLCYTAVITIAQSGNYVFESPFLRAMLIAQINNFVHIIHICRDGIYAAAEGFRTENMTLMSVTGTTNGVIINNLNADNVLRVFVLFK